MSLEDTIHASFAEAGLEPVEFEKPLKSISALVRFKKKLKPESLLDRHSLIGWAFSAPLDQFEKEMWQIKEFKLIHSKELIEIEMIAAISHLTFEDDYETWLDGIIYLFCGEDRKSYSYHWTPRYWKWDSAERVSEITGFTQTRGDGMATGLLEESK